MYSLRNSWDPAFKNKIPLSLHKYKRLPTTTTAVLIPEEPGNRECTDLVLLVLFLIIYLLMVPYLIYSLRPIDKRLLMNGHDDCMNICGVDNKHVKFKNCDPRDYTKETYTVFYQSDLHPKVPSYCQKDECEEEEQELILNRCFPKTENPDEETIAYKFIYEALDDMFNKMPLTIGSTIFVTLAAVGVVYEIYSCVPELTFWIIYVLQFFSAFILANFYWVLYGHDKMDEMLFLALVSSLFLIVLILTVLLPQALLWRERNVIIGLYKEVFNKCRDTFCGAFVVPLICLLFFLFMTVFIFYLILLIYTIKELDDHDMMRDMNWFILPKTAIVIYWTCGFLIGVNCITVAHIVITSYFTKTEFCFLISIWVTIRHHMGTALLGGLLIPIASIFKIITRCGRKLITEDENTKRTIGRIIIWPFLGFEEPVEYITRLNYIMTAMHGKEFLRSGKRAARIRWYFLLDTVTFDSRACYYIHMLSYCIMTFVLLEKLPYMSKYKVSHYYSVSVIVAYLAGLVTFLYASTTIIETLVLCFCEDALLNGPDRVKNKRIRKLIIEGLILGKHKKIILDDDAYIARILFKRAEELEREKEKLRGKDLDAERELEKKKEKERDRQRRREEREMRRLRDLEAKDKDKTLEDDEPDDYFTYLSNIDYFC